MRLFPVLMLCCWLAGPAAALAPACNSGVVFDDRDGDGRRDGDEPGIGGVAISDGVTIVRSGPQGAYTLPPVPGRTTFVIKPAGWRVGRHADGVPAFWRHQPPSRRAALKYGGIQTRDRSCRDFALRADDRAAGTLEVLLFGDPQVKTIGEVDYYARDIIDGVLARHPRRADVGLTLGDVVNDDLSLYPAMNIATARLSLPWLHLAGNHDLDFDAASDEQSLLSFRNTFGPDTFAWEEHEASFILLDDVIYWPGQQPAYIGGLREDQFAFLAAYLRGVPKDRPLVLAAHIPFFDPEPGIETFRRADRERLFALLAGFRQVLLLSAHGHVQRHHRHGAADGWQGPEPLHEYNLGAACGAYWSGVKDTRGIPDARMADGTPNGWAWLRMRPDGEYALGWESAGDVPDGGIGLHAPKVLRQGAYPAYGVYANVYMALPDAVVEFRVAGGPWQQMQRVARPDPGLVAENVRDDEAIALRGYDRSPEAVPSTHLWRGTLPTNLEIGEHLIEVRTNDPWRGGLSARVRYRLEAAAE